LSERLLDAAVGADRVELCDHYRVKLDNPLPGRSGALSPGR